MNGWSLDFSKYSSRDLSGKANIVQKRGGKVWGVVYEFDASEKSRLTTRRAATRRPQWTLLTGAT